MSVRSDTEPQPRVPLSKDRVVRTAVGIADERGIAAVTMRFLAQSLGVEAMSLYHHVASKNQLLDDMAEYVVAEINDRVGDPVSGTARDDVGWRGPVRRRILSARAVMLRHPWAPGLLSSRTQMTPAVMHYFDGLVGQLLQGGLSPDLAHHAMHALGSRALGFAQELFQPADGDAGADPGAEADAGGDSGPDTAAMLQQLIAQYPSLAVMLPTATHDGETTLGWCDDQYEFEFGLDLLLDGLERRVGPT